MKTLILFSSRDGQVHKIATHIAGVLTERQNEVELIDLHGVNSIDLSRYQWIIIGASIRYGHFHKSLNRFIKRYYQTLNTMSGAFYSVNLTARKADKRTPQTNVYTRKFLAQSLWQPDRSVVFAGAVRYSQYLWYQRLMVRLIMTITGGETDISKDVEYTDWQQVTDFANEIAGLSADKEPEK